MPRANEEARRSASPAVHGRRGGLGSLDLAAQHGELVAEHGDLAVLAMLTSEASKQYANEPPDHEVEEGQDHRRIIA
jgi:hypothetical protein